MIDGSKANKTGFSLEVYVANMLENNDYTRILKKEKSDYFSNFLAKSGKFYMTQIVVGETIFDTNWKVDFFIINNEVFPKGLIIECKWQQVAGSVDEKYPFLFENIKKRNIPTIVVLDGGGYKAGAHQWLLQKASLTDNPLIAVWSMQEFQINANNGYFT